MSFRFTRSLSAFALLSLAGSIAVAQQLSPSIHAVPDPVSSGQAVATGPFDDGRIIQLALHLPVRNQGELDRLLQQLYDPQSPLFHHYLTVEEYTAQFGPTQADYDAVMHWAQAKGFTVSAPEPNRRLVNIEGPVPVINAAFHIVLSAFQDSSTGRSYFAPDREPTLDLAVPLLAVTGLTNINPKVTHLKKGVADSTPADPPKPRKPSPTSPDPVRETPICPATCAPPIMDRGRSPEPGRR